jgi:lantibiotic modifying enzyme
MDTYKNKLQSIFNVLSKNEEKTPSLLSGNIGFVLFYFYFALYKNDQKIYDHAIKNLEKTITALQNESIPLLFSNGIAGIGLTLQHLIKNDFLIIKNNLFKDYFSILERRSISYLETEKFDYLHGGLGITLFLLAIEEEVNNKNYFYEVINTLEKTKKGNRTYKWSAKLNNEEGVYNISLSHGMSSIIIILSKIYNRYKIEKAKELIEKGVAFILNQKLPKDNFHSIYPSLALESTDKLYSSRLAWCYGDLGIGFALLHAGRVLQKNDWIDEAIQTFTHAALRRNLKQNGLVDASFCHGTAGVAHIFNRLYIDIGIKLFKDASDYWFEETLKMAKFNDGLVGYKFYVGSDEVIWKNEFGLLQGIAGIGLTLISKVSDIEPAWDELFLLS